MPCVLNAVVRFFLSPLLISKKLKCIEYLCLSNSLIGGELFSSEKRRNCVRIYNGICETMEKGNKVWLFV